jgi:nucleotide-binding universal stress UspA family protein
MFSRILIAVDGSKHSEKGIDMGKNLARSFGSEVIVLHVPERPATRFAAGTAEEDTGLADEVARSLKDASIDARAETMRAFTGQVGDTIAEVADANDADLIVMGSRGLSNLQGTVMGGKTQQLLHHTHRPVLVAR